MSGAGGEPARAYVTGASRGIGRAADALGGLDAFVACAVEAVQGPIVELDAHAFDRTMRVNARAVVLGAIAAAARMEDGRGRIVAVSSTGTHVVRNRRYACRWGAWARRRRGRARRVPLLPGRRLGRRPARLLRRRLRACVRAVSHERRRAGRSVAP
jgi:NAD(P)-dependent dehydrogenase (short-subunit alcohol dehydrogenase family)